MIATVALALGLLVQEEGAPPFADVLPAETETVVTLRDLAGLQEIFLRTVPDPEGRVGWEDIGLWFHEDFDLREASRHVHGEVSLACITVPTGVITEEVPEDRRRPADVFWVVPGPGHGDFRQVYEERIRDAEDRGVDVTMRAIGGVDVTILAETVYTFPLGDAFVVAFNEEHARDVIARGRGGAESSLAGVEMFRCVRRALDIPGPSISIYLAAGSMWSRHVNQVDQHIHGLESHECERADFVRFAQVLWQGLGLGGIEALGVVTAFGSGRTEVRSFAYIPRGPEGVLQFLRGTEGGLVWPEFQTDDGDFICSFHLDAPEAVGVLARAMGAYWEAQGIPADPERILPTEQRQQLIENLTGVFTILGRCEAERGDGETEANVALVSAVRNPEEVADCVASSWRGPPVSCTSCDQEECPEVRRQEDYMGTVLYLHSHRAMAVYGGYLLQGSVESVRLAIQRIGHPGRALQDREDFGDLTDELPLGVPVAAFFTRGGFSHLWPLITAGTSVDPYTRGWGWFGSLVGLLQQWLENGPAASLIPFLAPDELLAPALAGGLLYVQPRDDGVLLRIVLRYQQDP